MLLLFKQVSTQCRFPMNHHAEGKMYCVTSYRLGYKTDVQSPWKSYMENGNDKVLGTGRDRTLTEVCSLLAIGYSLSLGVWGGGEGFRWIKSQ